MKKEDIEKYFSSVKATVEEKEVTGGGKCQIFTLSFPHLPEIVFFNDYDGCLDEKISKPNDFVRELLKRSFHEHFTNTK